MSKRDFKILLQDIIEAIDKIQKYTKDQTFESFMNDSKTIDAVVRNFQIIGEASNRIPKNIIDNYPKIEWHKITSIRNRIVHDYFGLDYEIIWKIISKNLDDLKENVKEILNSNLDK